MIENPKVKQQKTNLHLGSVIENIQLARPWPRITLRERFLYKKYALRVILTCGSTQYEPIWSMISNAQVKNVKKLMIKNHNFNFPMYHMLIFVIYIDVLVHAPRYVYYLVPFNFKQNLMTGIRVMLQKPTLR